MKKILGIEVTDAEFDYLFCQQAKGLELCVENGKVVAREHIVTEEEKKANRVVELKGLLLKTDYQAIKFAEGQINAEDYEPIKAKRQAWRDEINKLETEVT